jgi:hypothetical protein
VLRVIVDRHAEDRVPRLVLRCPGAHATAASGRLGEI